MLSQEDLDFVVISIVVGRAAKRENIALPKDEEKKIAEKAARVSFAGPDDFDAMIEQHLMIREEIRMYGMLQRLTRDARLYADQNNVTLD